MKRIQVLLSVAFLSAASVVPGCIAESQDCDDEACIEHAESVETPLAQPRRTLAPVLRETGAPSLLEFREPAAATEQTDPRFFLSRPKKERTASLVAAGVAEHTVSLDNSVLLQKPKSCGDSDQLATKPKAWGTGAASDGNVRRAR